VAAGERDRPITVPHSREARGARRADQEVVRGTTDTAPQEVTLLAPPRRLALAAAFLVVGTFFVPSALGCGAGQYTYAGIVGGSTVSGVGARITPSASGFDVVAGHVAGWVGVGGLGQGPNGTNEWIQAGISAFPQWFGNDAYYEIARPHAAPVYHRISTSIPAGVPMRVSVLEIYRRPDWWRVWVNGSPASPAIHLPSSHARWRPVATAESWDGGTSLCNDFLYRFEAVSVAHAAGGRWSRLASASWIENANTRIASRTTSGFYAAGGEVGLRTLASALPTPLAAPQP
jgi:hypothetical protein